MAELAGALREFKREYNEGWLIGRHGHRAPGQVRRDLRCGVQAAARIALSSRPENPKAIQALAPGPSRLSDRPAAGLLSFPREGVTLALDFRNSAALPALFTRLDDIVRAAGGRLYPAKDARMPRELYQASYPDLAAFTEHRDPGMSSGMSRRLMGF